MAGTAKPDPKQLKEAQALIKSLTEKLNKSTEAGYTAVKELIKAEARVAVVASSLIKTSSSFDDENLDGA
jgi:hypothetical protein